MQHQNTELSHQYHSTMPTQHDVVKTYHGSKQYNLQYWH